MNAIPTDPGILSAQMAALMAMVEAETGPLPDPTLLPPAEGRAQSARSNQRWNVNLPEMASEQDLWIAADPALGSARCRMRVLTPENAEDGVVVFVHGGGFAFCSPETHERCARVLAIETRMTVAMPDYRLAPENPFPAGLLDTVACLRAILDGAIRGLDSRSVFMSGDSAGANLALAAMLHEDAAGRSLPDAGLLFYGNYAADLAGPSYTRFENGPGLTTAKMRRYWDWYAGTRTISTDPLACPLAASDAALSRLPPLYLMAAGVDPLFSDTATLHARLKAMGRDDAFDIVAGVTHGFLQNTNELEAARGALKTAGAAARAFKTRP
ncbi:MAG: alpha/beta hydrolase [Desulfomicrobium sp.]|uniref:alpha/beta hydrolase n=1 Tax=Hoeflea sp. TaxID=1940281 RepID=UPI0025B887B2|nr:alpha/beta hydrolase [Hoeflea sp.]MBU4527137.1 alpha/beta hydrolase [Alphaproteobacteria bacterium]MBV1713907.1 alpha/beta hydrolase [Desulfomicrobium sp.]MBU4544119.1 alpha/beta hydrolase [Alphaproteobacteria bacterium]MBU4552319.1 alpha/beta hydrolase [Alphaproteobacteria bacterium]MBV1782294.1 alpha/beta hydrolase [Hoeflea sp.]